MNNAKCRGTFRRLKRERDLGTTMMELVVGMTLMGVFMTMFAAAITMMYNTANKTESLNETSAQLNVVFNRLDTLVRYASAISEWPTRAADGNWYVELQTTNTGSTVCTQLRLNTGEAHQLEQRTWNEPIASSADGPTDWVPIASNIFEDVDSKTGEHQNSPFRRKLANQQYPSDEPPNPPDQPIGFQQLHFRMLSKSGANRTATTSVSDITFTALNSTPATPEDGICTPPDGVPS